MRQLKDSGVKWIGQVPEGWEIRRIKNCADNTIQDSFIDGDWIESPYIEDSGIRYITTGNVGNGRFKEQGNAFISEKNFKELNCKYSYSGELVFSRLNSPYGRSCILPHTFKKYVLAVDLVTLRTRENINYICYQTQCEGYQKSVEDKSAGTTMKRISRTNLGNVNILIPPLPEQRAIAAYLDEKCGDIDRLVSIQEEMIEELKAYKQSLITEAVTKGLDPNAKLKPSGIEWIGEIPEGWEVDIIKHTLKWKSVKGKGEALVLSLYRDLGVIPKDSRDDNHNVTSEKTDDYKFVEVGDFVINKMKAWQGSMAISEYEGIVSPAYYICSFENDKIHKKFFHYLLRNQSYLPEYRRLSAGLRIGQWDLGWDDFRNIPIVVPPLPTQRAIASYLDTKTAEIDRLINLKQQKITELKEYKKSLIYECVTGKKEIV